jgi:tetraacyldisaccharide 4'-kinase
MSYWSNVLSGAEGGAGPALLRAATGVIEPFYSTAMRVRNRLFDAGMLPSHDLGRPTISVGNITAGGTGKTPMVRWLAEKLRERGRHVAVLARGYKSSSPAGGDEQIMLERALNGGCLPRVELLADPDRVRAAAGALRRDPSIDLFVLDDGFQHRRARRNLDLVLLNGPEPFGFGHVLPRGLLREPLAGLGRAGAIVVTHADQISAAEMAAIESQVRRYGPQIPVYRSVHEHVALWNSAAGAPDARRPMETLGQVPFFAFAGIGSPARLDQQLSRWGATCRGSRWFADHHAYSAGDLRELESAARSAGAEVLLTTEKDWAKLSDLPPDGDVPIWRIEMAMRFLDGDEERLLRQVVEVVDRAAANPV